MSESASERSGGLWSPEDVEAMETIVAELELPESVKRMLAGHDEPDAGCILDAIGKLVILTSPRPLLPLMIGTLLAQAAPEGAKELINRAVDASASHLIEELADGLSFPDEHEANR